VTEDVFTRISIQTMVGFHRMLRQPRHAGNADINYTS